MQILSLQSAVAAEEPNPDMQTFPKIGWDGVFNVPLSKLVCACQTCGVMCNTAMLGLSFHGCR